MKKNFLKAVSFVLILTMLLFEIYPAMNGSEDTEATPGDVVVAMAAEGGEYKVAYAGVEYSAGSTINYKVNETGDAALIQVIPPEEGNYRVEWTSTDTAVAELVEQSGRPFYCGLRVNSPGYTGVSAVVYDAATNAYKGTINVSVHVPLEFNDPDGEFLTYGLKTDVQLGTTSKTLQLFTPDSYECAAAPSHSHFLRQLKCVEYTVSGSAVVIGKQEYDIDPDKVSINQKALDSLVFSSSNTDVAIIKNGCIQAVGAGFARITVTTKSKSTTGESDSLTFNVVVAPEVKEFNGTVTEGHVPGDRFSGDCTGSQIILQTNAVHADYLNWAVFMQNTSGTGYGKDISTQKGVTWDISAVNGRLVLTGLEAGVYTIVGIAKKDGAVGYSYDNSDTYSFTNDRIKKIEVTVRVPLAAPAGPIVMNVYNDDLFDTYDIFENSNLPRDCFSFASDNPFVAQVGANDGIISAVAEGTAHIRISVKSEKLREYFGDAASSMTIPDIEVRVINGCTLNASSETVYLKSTYQLLLTSPYNYSGGITWTSSDEKVVTVNDDGLVTAVGVGTATVTAKIKISGVTKKAKCKFKVIDAITGIELTAKKDQVVVGDTINISAKLTPNSAVADLEWRCSDESIARIADTTNTTVTMEGVKPGTVVVSAVNKQNVVVGTFILYVVDDPTGISLSDTEVTVPLSYGYYQLYATVTPELPAGDVITWTSSNTKIATVSGDGKVKLLLPGTVVITVTTKNGLLATCTLVITQSVSSIKFDTTNKQMYVGETFRITYTIMPKTASNTELKWSSTDTSVAVVDATGLVTAKGTGKTVIMAITNDGTAITATCTITVKRTAKSLSVDVKSLVLGVGDPYLLEVTLQPEDSSDTITFESSNTKVATVSKKGKVIGKGVGSCVIMVTTDTGLTQYVAVTVTQSVMGISVSPDKATIKIGETIDLSVTLEPKTASDNSVTWESADESVATVNSRGEVKGIAGGTVVITATSDESGHSDFAVITVEELVTEIKLNETNYKLGVGKSFQLIATILGERATNKKVSWKTSKKSVCKVTKNGKITGVKEGYATITCMAKDGSGAEATCEVHVVTQMRGLELDPTYITLVQGNTKKITATVTPKGTTYKPIWSSSDTSVAVVNSKGTVTGIKPGNCVITAAANDNSGITESCYINVIAPVYVTSVTFSQSEVIMTPGEKQTVPYSIIPNNTTETYSWSSDNPGVASVNSKTGMIKANSIGSATVTILTQSGKKGSVMVYVVGLSQTYMELHQYEQNLITLEVDGRGASNLRVRWDTDNQNIAPISNGKITGKAVGTTTVYAVVNGRRLACKVRVIKN